MGTRTMPISALAHKSVSSLHHHCGIFAQSHSSDHTTAINYYSIVAAFSGVLTVKDFCTYFCITSWTVSFTSCLNNDFYI